MSLTKFNLDLRIKTIKHRLAHAQTNHKDWVFVKKEDMIALVDALENGLQREHSWTEPSNFASHLRLHMGELTSDELGVAKGAYRLAMYDSANNVKVR